MSTHHWCENDRASVVSAELRLTSLDTEDLLSYRWVILPEVTSENAAHKCVYIFHFSWLLGSKVASGKNSHI
jgi:hypothetical protein